MRFFVHSGEATQEVVERYDSATLALEAVSVINQTVPNIRVFNEYGEQVSPARTVRSIRMALSLAFLAPEIVKAAVEGHLPRGFGLKRLVDLPMAWPDQWRTLGLQMPAQA